MRAREKEARYGRSGGSNFGRRDRSRRWKFTEHLLSTDILCFSRDRRQRSASPIGRDRRRAGASRSRSPYSRSPVSRR